MKRNNFNRIKKIVKKVLTYVLLIAVMVILLFPIAFIILSSFKSNREFLLGGTNLLPQQWTLQNYVEAWNTANFGRYTFNSIYFSGIATILILFVTTMMGYCFDRGQFVGKKFIMSLYMSTIFIAGATTVYPVFELCVKLGINKSLNGLIIASVGGLQVMNTFLIMGYVKTIPREIDESAKLDGCSFFRIYWNMILPLIKPMAATVGILSFQGTWNSYMLPLAFTISNEDLRTLTVGVVALKSESLGSTPWNIVTAGSTIALVPVLIIFAIMNKQIVSGIVSGAVKG